MSYMLYFYKCFACSIWVDNIEPYVFYFQGELRYFSRSLLLAKGMPIVYLQIYIIDTKKPIKLKMLGILNAYNRQWLSSKRHLKTTILFMCIINKLTKIWSINMLMVLQYQILLHICISRLKQTINDITSSLAVKLLCLVGDEGIPKTFVPSRALTF